MKRDLLIEYDESLQEIRFYETSNQSTRKFEIKVPVSLLTEHSADSAERMLGAAVFAFLDRRATKKIGLRDYAAEAAASVLETREAMREQASNGGAVAKYHLALDTLAQGLRNRSLKDIQEAEALLLAAAAAGNVEAQDYLDRHWEREKAAAIRACRS